MCALPFVTCWLRGKARADTGVDGSDQCEGEYLRPYRKRFQFFSLILAN